MCRPIMTKGQEQKQIGDEVRIYRFEKGPKGEYIRYKKLSAEDEWEMDAIFPYTSGNSSYIDHGLQAMWIKPPWDYLEITVGKHLDKKD